MDALPLLESAPDAMVVTDAGGRIRLVNAQAERLFGYRRDELVDQPIEMLVPPWLRERHRGQREGFVRQPLARPMGSGLELFALRKDGSEVPVEISLSPLRSERGILTIVSAIRDISERRRYERALEEKNEALLRANAAKDQFLASMSHELRTPLNAIIGFTGTMLMKLPGPLTADQEKQLHIVQSSARHLLSLINDMLDLAKIESGRADFHSEPVSIGDVAGQVMESLRSLAGDKSIELRADLPEQPLVVITDLRAVRQILLNLTTNAIKYTEAGSISIVVTAQTVDGTRNAVVSVSDTGIGIRAEDAARLFHAFEQLDRSNSRRGEGVGLGLYLSHKLATLLGGSLTFAPTDAGGSTFALSLPLER